MKTDPEIEKLLAAAESPNEREALKDVIARSREMLTMHGATRGFCIAGYVDQWKGLLDAAKNAGWTVADPGTSLEIPSYLSVTDARSLSKVLKQLVVGPGEGVHAAKRFLKDIRKTLKSGPVVVDFCKLEDLGDFVKAVIGPVERLKLRLTGLPPVQ